MHEFNEHTQSIQSTFSIYIKLILHQVSIRTIKFYNSDFTPSNRSDIKSNPPQFPPPCKAIKFPLHRFPRPTGKPLQEQFTPNQKQQRPIPHLCIIYRHPAAKRGASRLLGQPYCPGPAECWISNDTAGMPPSWGTYSRRGRRGRGNGMGIR